MQKQYSCSCSNHPGIRLIYHWVLNITLHYHFRFQKYISCLQPCIIFLQISIIKHRHCFLLGLMNAREPKICTVDLCEGLQSSSHWLCMISSLLPWSNKVFTLHILVHSYPSVLHTEFCSGKEQCSTIFRPACVPLRKTGRVEKHTSSLFHKRRFLIRLGTIQSHTVGIDIENEIIFLFLGDRLWPRPPLPPLSRWLYGPPPRPFPRSRPLNLPREWLCWVDIFITHYVEII